MTDVRNTTEEAIEALRKNVASETYILPVAQQKLILAEIERLRSERNNRISKFYLLSALRQP